MGGTIAFLQADAVYREVFNPRKMVSVAVWERESAQDLLALPSALFPEPHDSISPHTTLVYSEPSSARTQGKWLPTHAQSSLHVGAWVSG